MKNRKTIFLFVLVGILSCSGVLDASADSVADLGMLKSGLLLIENGNPQYNIYDYNTNDDNTVNVFDLCRAKKNILETRGKQTQNVKLSCSRPWTTEDKSMITIPVSISGNTLGVSALSFYVSYDTWRFKLENVYSSTGNVSFSQSSDYVQFSSKDGSNITAEGDILYLQFSVRSDVPYDKYRFSLDEIEAAMFENGSERELSEKECPYTSDVLSFTFSRTVQNLGVTTTVTVSVTTENSTITTTTKVTQPPVNNKMAFSMNNAELSSDGRHLKVPVYMDGNTTGVFSVNMIVKYDQNKFTLSGVSQGEYDGYGYVGGNNDNAVFNTYNNQNITDFSCIIAYLEFEVNGNADSGTYQFEMTDIKAYYSENWNQKEIQKDMYNDKSVVYKYSFEKSEVTTIVPWTTPVITQVTTVPWMTETTPMTTTVTLPFEAADLENTEKDIVELINRYRNSKSMNSLVASPGLCRAADERAKELSIDFSVDRPNGGSLTDLFVSNGENILSYSYVYVATGTSAGEVYNNIMNARSLDFDDSDYSKIGMGHYHDSNSQYVDYWVVFVGR